MFDWKKPTVQMLGRWQPWHDGHQALFKRCIAKTGPEQKVGRKSTDPGFVGATMAGLARDCATGVRMAFAQTQRYGLNTSGMQKEDFLLIL